MNRIIIPDNTPFDFFVVVDSALYYEIAKTFIIARTFQQIYLEYRPSGRVL